jgi:hypothetical protein
MRGNDRLEREVAALGGLSREELAHRWAKAYGCPPPKGVKRGLLERAAAWQLQARMLGGLSPEGRRALKTAIREYELRLARGRSPLAPRQETAPAVGALSGVTAGAHVSQAHPQISIGGPGGGATRGRKPERLPGRRQDSSPAQRIVLSPGARLLREWNGRQHFAEVAEDGYVFDGKTYRSLSAVARRITGAHWSGPRFFGL